MVIIWHVLADMTEYRGLGADHFTRYDTTDAKKRRLVRELETLGCRVTIQPAAGPTPEPTSPARGSLPPACSGTSFVSASSRTMTSVVGAAAPATRRSVHDRKAGFP